MGRLFESKENGIPFGPSAGAINGNSKEEIVQRVRDVVKSPADALTIGTYTPQQRIPNDSVYEHRNGSTYNRMKLPNIGKEKAVRLFPDLKARADGSGKSLIVSVGFGENEDPAEVLPQMVGDFADAGAEYIEINYSCPSLETADKRNYTLVGYDLPRMLEIDQSIASQYRGIKLLRKLPLYSDRYVGLINEVSTGFEQIAAKYGEAILVLSNSVAGYSGPKTSVKAREELRRFRSLQPQNVRLVSCLGITNGAEVYRRVDKMGADFTGGVTVCMENEKHGISYGQTMVRFTEQYDEARETDESKSLV